MDKGFNDDELADIMNEIENLEQEFAEDDAQAVEEPGIDEVAESVMEMAAEEDIGAEEEIEGSEQVMEKAPLIEEVEVLDELSEMPAKDIVPEEKIHEYDDNVHQMSAPEEVSTIENIKTAKTAMNFHVEGNMKLDLSFTIGENQIKLHVSDEGFEIELEGGAKFTLPIKTDQSLKNVA